MLKWHFTKKLPEGYLIIYHNGCLWTLANFLPSSFSIDKINGRYFYATTNKKDFTLLLENTEEIYTDAIIWASNNIKDCDSVSTIVGSLIDNALSLYDRYVDWPNEKIIKTTTDIF